MDKRYKLLLVFAFCYIYMLFFPSLIPYAKVLYFCPFMVLLFANTSFHLSIWLGTLAAFILDLHSSSTPLGFTCLNYLLTTLLIYRFRIYFLEDHIHVFTLYAVLFSVCSTFIHFILYAMIDMKLKIHLFTLLTDLIILPLFDAIYCLLFFLYPLAVISYLLSPKSRYFFKFWWKKITRRFQSTFKKLRLPL